MYEKLLENITEFNHALIYAFEPESSPEELNGSTTFEDCLYPAAGQHQDMLNAYLYAQKTILPILGKSKLTNENLSQWIMNLHGLIGKTLLETDGLKSGKYADGSVFRWHSGSTLCMVFINYLSGLTKFNSANGFAEYLKENTDVNKESILEFILLLERIRQNKNIKLTDPQNKAAGNKDELSIGKQTLFKLHNAFNNNLLTEEEKKTVNNIVKICIPPEKTKDYMDKFFAETVDNYNKIADKYKHCKEENQNDMVNEISDFLANVFYALTEIHPFANANGRTATCLINIFLRSFNLPSILLRHPGENKDPKSQYSQAFKEIDVSREPLKKLFLARINDAINNGDYKNDELKQVISLRVRLAAALKDLKSTFPKFDINKVCETPKSMEVYKNVEYKYIHRLYKNDHERFIELYSVFLSETVRLNKKTSYSKAGHNVLPTKIVSGKEKEELVKSISLLATVDGWKIYEKNGLQMMVELPDQASKADDIADKLKKLNIMDVSRKVRKDNNIPVILCSNINHKKLNELASEQKRPETTMTNQRDF